MRASESFPSFSDDDLDEDEMIRAGDRVSGSPVAAVGRGEMGSRARVVAPVDARAEARAEARGGEVSEDDAVFERMEGEYAQLSLQPGRREEEEVEDVDDWDDIYFVDYVDEDEDDDEDDDEDYVAEEGTEDTRYYSAPDESDVSSVMEEIQETQGNEDDDDVEITQVVTRDARGMESHGSARDTLRAMNSQAIGGDRREPSVQPSPATTDYANMSDTEFERKFQAMLRERQRRGRPWEQEDDAQNDAQQFAESHEPADRLMPRRVRPRTARPGRPRRRRGIVDGQQTLDGFIRHGVDRDMDHDVIIERVQPARPRRTLDVEQVCPNLPRTAESLYENWENTAQKIIPDGVSIYSNFLYAFGDDTDEGRRYRREEIMRIGQVLLQFEQTKEPGQQAILKGREREGKTGALFSIALLALILRMRVVILCAPNKVTPIVDMVRKLERAGFGSMFNTKHTLGKKAINDNALPSAEVGQIFVAALGTVGDLKKVKSFIEGERRGGHLTVTLVDECDELTQGKGQKSILVPHRENHENYQHYIDLDQRGEDDQEHAFVAANSLTARQKSVKEKLAAASCFFKEHIYPKTQLIACSATLSGYIMNPVGVFRNDLVTPIFEVFPKIGYAGINRFLIPEGCDLEHEGNMSLDAFKESSAANRLLERFYRRENACDGRFLQPRERSGARPMTLRGMLFISCHTAVNVAGGVDDFAKAIERKVQGWGTEHDPQTTLFVCFVGKPRVRFAGKMLQMKTGASFETIYNETAKRARQGKFDNVRLGQNEPFSKICTHCVLIGYSMTRRAMTAAFSPQDEPHVLCKIQYGILTAPKSLVIDAVSQRINRPSHEFAEHVVPDDYCIDVAMSPVTLEICKEYRAMEDEMSKKQRESPVVHSEFIQSINVHARNLEDVKISKRGLRLGDLSATGRKQRAREKLSVNPDHIPFLQDFKEWLSVQEYRLNQRYAAASVESYFMDSRRWFTSGADIDDIYPLVKERIALLEDASERDGVHQNEISANKLLCEFYEERRRQAAADAA